LAVLIRGEKVKQIVIVDSSETFVKYASRVISRMGYEIHPAFDVKTGFALIAGKKPDLVLLEINVSNRTGIKLYARMRSDPRTAGIPLVIVTVDGTMESRERGKLVGCSDYLTKPLTVRDIHLMLQRNLPFLVKRRVMRLNIAVNADIGSGDRRIEIMTTTLGEGGMLVRSDHPVFKNGSRVDISLYLSTAEAPVKLIGEVIYICEAAETSTLNGVGIKFVDIEPDAAARLTRFIEEAI
jgi:CheY-like chemotaxis protein/Tfp pilus assembly protein PilZ